MKRYAEHNRCPVCDRGSAMIDRRIGDRFRVYCRWIDRGLCAGGPEADRWAARAQQEMAARPE